MENEGPRLLGRSTSGQEIARHGGFMALQFLNYPRMVDGIVFAIHFLLNPMKPIRGLMGSFDCVWLLLHSRNRTAFRFWGSHLKQSGLPCSSDIPWCLTAVLKSSRNTQRSTCCYISFCLGPWLFSLGGKQVEPVQSGETMVSILP